MRILENWDVTSLYPNLARIYGYSSRNQKDKQAYVNLLDMRMKAKKGLLSEDFLAPMNLTNADLNMGLKLPLNAYTGTLRATFNKLYDNLQGFSICTTGQCLILQLIHDLQQVPTLEMVSANTDAVMYTIEEEYKEQAHKVLEDWQVTTKLELEEDKVVKIIMRDVNNYAEIVQVKDDNYEVHYKGGELTRGEHKFKWNKEKKTFEYTFKDSLKSNSMSIVSEALLKFLLFDIPIRHTIEKCDDIFRFQIISHLGSTYEKMVQEPVDCSDEIKKLEKEYEIVTNRQYEEDLKIIENNDYKMLDEWCKSQSIHFEQERIRQKIMELKNQSGQDVELQRNNRIYAGKKPSGVIIKVKSNGRRDSLANCPPNPIVDNANQCTIDDINKEWYIEFAEEKANDFLGIKRLENYKKDELLELAKELNIDVDKKTKKDKLIEIIKQVKRGGMLMATKKEVKENVQPIMVQDLENEKLCKISLLRKINEFRKRIRTIEFVFDEELPNNLGGREYYSIDQFYNAVQDTAVEVGLDFSFETTDIVSFEKELVKPSGKLPIHVVTVKTLATLTDIDTGYSKEYVTIAQGSDTMDKAMSGASTSAFRQWFYKNFTPKNMSEEELEETQQVEKSEPPKVPVYIPETKKEEIKKEVVAQVQQESTDNEDIKEICENIMKIRQALGDDEYGAKTLEKVMSGTLSDADIMEIDLKIKNKMEKVGL